jgi:hypothetical protein
MSYFRSYFSKNNTIIKGTSTNTAKNPVTQIYYGSSFSKYLFQIDFSGLKAKITNGDLVIDNSTKHYLNMTNCVFGDPSFLGQNTTTGMQRATSFDLIIFEIPEFWDEGVGFDYTNGGFDYTTGNNTYDVRPSNWFYKDTLHQWTSNGVYGTDPVIVATAHFDNGNENLKADISNYVNGILSGNTNNGLGIAFAVEYQDLVSEIDKSIAFFSKYTQTFYEPFVETVIDDRIVDNRYDFTEKLQQNLLLYVTQGSEFVDLDNIPSVDILDSSKSVITSLDDIQATKLRKGVYQVTFGISGMTCNGKSFFYDTWKNLSIGGIALDNVTQRFIAKPITNKFLIGQNPTDTQRYAIQYYGIRQSESMKSGEHRKIVITFKSIDNPIPMVMNEVYYKIYVKEGLTQVIVHDWTLMDSTNENSFFLDTSIYIPREYFMEIKARVNGEEILYHNTLKYSIESER